MSIKETKEGVLLTIFVKPNSSQFKIQLDNEEVIVYATEEPEKGKVNKEILKELSRLLGLRPEIISGSTSKQKILLFRGINIVQVEAALKKIE